MQLTRDNFQNLETANVSQNVFFFFLNGHKIPTDISLNKKYR